MPFITNEGPGDFDKTYYIHTCNGFTSEVLLPEVYNPATSADIAGMLKAYDAIRVYLIDDDWKLFVNTPEETDDYVPVEACGRVPITVSVYPSDGDAVEVTLRDSSSTNPVKFYEASTGGTGVTEKTFAIKGGVSSKTYWVSGQVPETAERTIELIHPEGSKTLLVTVIKLDLDIWNGGSDLDNGEAPGPQGGAVAEEHEESTGAFVLVNWDDDDADGKAWMAENMWETPIPDLDEVPETSGGTIAVNNEDNLAKLLPTLSPDLASGIVELRVAARIGQIRLWTESFKDTIVELPTGTSKSWDLSVEAERTGFNYFSTNGLWIEALDRSMSEKDVQIQLVFRGGDTDVVADTVKATFVMINLGNAVYHKSTRLLILDRGHAAFLYSFIGTCCKADIDNAEKYEIIEMLGDGVHKNLLTSMSIFTTRYWGAFCPLDITYSQRLRAMRAAGQIWKRRADISYTWPNAVFPEPWNGNISSITKLRCDGLVEASYECVKTDVPVWGKIGDTPPPHYSMWVYTSEHNDFDAVWWKDTLMPATQCAEEDSQRGSAWETTFEERDIYQPNMGGTLP